MPEAVKCQLQQVVETRSVGDTYSARVAQTDDEHGLRRMQAERYMKNLVVLWNHDRTEKLPIASTKSLEMNDDWSWDAEFEFLPGDQFAKRIKNAWDRGFINAASVGFVTKNVGIQLSWLSGARHRSQRTAMRCARITRS